MSDETLPAPPIRAAMRDEIKCVATRLLMLRGYRGVSYGDIARELEPRRPISITILDPKRGSSRRRWAHHVEQVGGRFRRIWTAPEQALPAKVEATIAFNREAFTQLNPQGG